MTADSLPPSRFRYRIGVDVGGTNTDAALIGQAVDDADAAAAAAATTKQPGPASAAYQVLASSKAATTADVTSGICTAIADVLAGGAVDPAAVQAVNIGTTHFINAVVQRDARNLRRVAVLRLCGPFGRQVAPFADWPTDLRDLVEGPVGYLSGGLEIDGRIIAPVDDAEVREHARRIEAQNIATVVVVGVFTMLDTASPSQEQHVRALLQAAVPGLDVVCSADVGSAAPFLERENAAILNASILAFGRRTVRRFIAAFRRLRLARAQLFLTQNDGTVMDARTALHLPIRTFSSGATNSLSGALFLAGLHRPMTDKADKAGAPPTGPPVDAPDIDPATSQVIMVDIGGTTTDFAALAPSGFPRQSPAIVRVGGVRTAFSLPEILSIGLGGGSHVIVDAPAADVHPPRVSVGPTSVGFRLSTLSRCFGGNVLTATDIVVASSSASSSSSPIGTHSVAYVPEAVVRAAKRSISRQLERSIEDMKVSTQDVVLLLVGGGSIIVDDGALHNVKACIRPPFFDVANAVGAAIAKISADVDQIIIPDNNIASRVAQQQQVVDDAKVLAVELACSRGARRHTVAIVEVECTPLQDAGNGAYRVIVRASGELAWDAAGADAATDAELLGAEDEDEADASDAAPPTATKATSNTDAETPLDIRSYRPNVCKATGEWFVSETDLAFIAEGCGILGTGGGGTAYGTQLQCVGALRKFPGKMRIIDPTAIDPESRVCVPAFIGNERLISSREFEDACGSLCRLLGVDMADRTQLAGLLSGEIGGANGMVPLFVGAALDMPVLDGDSIGRAFPRIDLSLPYVYGVTEPFPAAVADPRGISYLIAQMDTPRRFEDVVRALTTELGLCAAFAGTLTGHAVREYTCHRTVSQTWFIGRAIQMARLEKTSLLSKLEAEIPGCRSIFSGRVVNVIRGVQGGWTIGTATVEPAGDDESEDSSDIATAKAGSRPLFVEYQNEYYYAALVNPDGSHEPVCTSPDLITIIDSAGASVSTHEVRYGLMVTVIIMPAHPLWTAPEGVAAAGPAAFGKDTTYVPMATKYQPPRSVIEEFGV